MSMSCAVRDMRLANSAAFSPLDGTAVERRASLQHTPGVDELVT